MKTAGEPRLEYSIKEHFAPVVRRAGFKGSGRTFHRASDTVLQVVHVQGSQYGGKFCVEFGIQPLCAPDVTGGVVNPSKTPVHLCELRRRLAETGGDQWWSHDGTQAGMDKAARAAALVYERIGKPLLDTYRSIDVYRDSTVADLAGGQVRLDGTTELRMAVLLARVRLHEKRPAEALLFIEYGERLLVDPGMENARDMFQPLLAGLRGECR